MKDETSVGKVRVPNYYGFSMLLITLLINVKAVFFQPWQSYETLTKLNVIGKIGHLFSAWIVLAFLLRTVTILWSKYKQFKEKG